MLPPRATCSSTSHSRCFADHRACFLASSPLVPFLQVSRKAHWHRTEPGTHSRWPRPSPRSSCDVPCLLACSRACVGRASECQTPPERTACPSSCEQGRSHMEWLVVHLGVRHHRRAHLPAKMTSLEFRPSMAPLEQLASSPLDLALRQLASSPHRLMLALAELLEPLQQVAW